MRVSLYVSQLKGPIAQPVATPNHTKRAYQSVWFDRMFAAVAGLEQRPLGTIIVV